ncbi:MAG: 2-dehydropantoate 2-reductase [Steroidobacteraceae bacterium]
MSATLPSIGIFGAGAVGCFYGALLAQAGHAVTLIGRPALVESVTAHGLQLETAAGIATVAMQASTDPAALAAADWVLCCVKSADTEMAGQALQPHLKRGAVVLSFQNGVDNAPRLQAVLGQPVIPAVLYVAAGMLGANHVKHFGRNEIVLGAAPSSGAIAAALNAAGIATRVSERVLEALWEKLITNCAYNGISAVAQLPYGRMVQAPGVADFMTDIVAECVAVANAAGVAINASIIEPIRALAATMPQQLSSTARDLERGRHTEIDYLNGYVVQRGAALGIATPANRAVYAMVKLLESRFTPDASAPVPAERPS